MRLFLLLTVFLSLTSFSTFSVAVDYSWKCGSNGCTSQPDPKSSVLQSLNLQGVDLSGWTFESCSFIRDDLAYCNWQKQITPTSTDNRGNYTNRYGDSCPDTYTYNPLTGICDPPEEEQCESKKDQSTTFTKSGTAPDSYAVVLPGGTLGQETSACFSSCVVSTSDQKCVVNPFGNYTCQGTAYYTGQKCTTGAEVDYTDSPKEPEPETTTKDKPCQYIEQADGTLRCDSEKSTEKEGQSCGTVNGVKKCYDTKPTKDGVEIETEVKTETTPDGTSTTTKTDTATKTTCSGINSCASTTTTTTTTIEKDADGKTNSISGVCTGEACPDKNTNPDGDGDGFGDCVGGDCTGTAGGPLGSPELEEVAGFGETTTGFAERIAASPIIAAIDGIGLNGGGSCSMSSGTTIIGTIDASSFCDNSNWLDPLYYVFLAIHALVAVRVFLSA